MGKEETNRQVKSKFRQIFNRLSSLIFTDPNIQNRDNFVQERNENHERGHSQEGVLEDGISHGSELKRAF